MADPDWKKYEALIGWIVKTIHPDATVTPNATMIDKDTGEPRQIDVLIEWRHGQIDLRIIGEVRNRNAVPDVRWVEEVASKRVSVGADSAFLVSASGFGAPAIAKARAWRIGVLRLEEAVGMPWTERLLLRSVAVQDRSLAVDISTLDSRTNQPFKAHPNHQRRWARELAHAGTAKGATLAELAATNSQLGKIVVDVATQAWARLSHQQHASPTCAVAFRYTLPRSISIRDHEGNKRRVRHAEAIVTFTRVETHFPLTLMRYGDANEHASAHAVLLSGQVEFRRLPFGISVVLPGDGSVLVAGATLSAQVEPLTPEAAVAFEGFDVVAVDDGEPVDGVHALGLRINMRPRVRNE